MNNNSKAKSPEISKNNLPKAYLALGSHISSYPSSSGSANNLLLGSVLKKATKKEADSGSSNVAPLRARESAYPNKGSIQIRSRFNEAKQSPDLGKRFKVVLIKEGLGNLNDCFYYTRESLEGATQLFEGVKCYADHPSSIEEQTRPERSTRDILGHFENVEFEETEDGRGQLIADLCIIDDPAFDWARGLLVNAVEYAKKHIDSEFVGLSINANGEASSVSLDEFMRDSKIPSSIIPKLQKAKEEGISEIRPVTSLKEATSCDLVTEAGAGGKILKMIEQERKPMAKKIKESKHESEGKEMEKKSKQTESEGDDDGHADAEQDKALFQKMIKQYLGDEHMDDKEAMEMAYHAHEAAKEETKDPQEAYEKAGNHLKMAMKIGQKMNQKKENEKKESEKHESESESHKEDDEMPPKKKKGADHGDGDGDEDDKEESESHKESASSLRTQLLKLKAENAKLSEANKKFELDTYLETKMKESKMPVTVTKKFREALGTPKSKGEIDQAFKIFKATFDGVVSEEVSDFSSFMFTEKSTTRFEESAEGKLGTLEDCTD